MGAFGGPGGGGSGNDIQIKVTLEGEQAKRELGLLGKIVEAFKQGLREGAQEQKRFESGLRSTADAVNPLKGSFTELDSKLNLLARGFGSVSSSYSQLSTLFARSRDVEGVTAAFQSLQNSVGQLSGDTLNRLRAATQGTVSDLELMKRANQAVLLGLPIQQFDEMAGAAIKLGRAMGLEAGPAIESLTIGVGRQSKLVLDNLGIIVSAEEAYASFAAQNRVVGRELTDTEKKLAFQQLAFKRIREAAQNAGETVASAATEFGRLDKSIENLGDKFAASVSGSSSLATEISRLRGDVDAAIPAIEQLGSAVASLGGLFLQGTDAIAGVISRNVVTPARDALAALSEAPQNADATEQFLDSVFGTEEEVKQNLARKLGAARTEATKEAARIAEETGKAQAAAAEGLERIIDKLEIKKIDGFNDAYVDRLYKSYVDLTLQFKKGSINAEDFANELTKLTKANTFTESQYKDLQKVIDSAMKDAEDQFQKGKDAAEDFRREQKRLNDELDRLRDSVQGLVGNGPIEQFRNAIIDAFQQADSAKDLEERIVKIGEAARKAGVSISDFTAAVRAEQSGDTILGPGNAAGEREFKRQVGSNSPQSFWAIGQDAGALLASGLEGGLIAALARVGEVIAQQISKAILDGFSSADVGPAVNQLSQSLFGTITGPIIGSFLEVEISKALEDSASTKARKAADKFFADVFDADRLSIIVGNEVKQIRDLVFQGDTLFGGADLEFGGEGANNPFSFLSTLPAQTQAAFASVGAAFEQLLDIGEDVGGQLAAVFANNVGGSLNNLQLLVEATGKSFEDLSDAIFQAFFNGTLTIQEMQNALITLQDIMTVGIPGAVGAVDQAISNLQVALNSPRPGRALFDALVDIGAEAREVGQNDFPALVRQIAAAFGAGAEQVKFFFEAMKMAGINSVKELADATDAQLSALANNIQQAIKGEAPTNAPAQIPGQQIGQRPNFSAPRTGGSSGASSGKSKAETEAERARREAAQQLKQLADETFRTVTASEQYKKLLDQLNAGLISNAQFSKQARALYSETRDTIERLKKAQEDYAKALAGQDARNEGLKDLRTIMRGIRNDGRNSKKLVPGLEELRDELEEAGLGKRSLKDLDDAIKALGKGDNKTALAELQRALQGVSKLGGRDVAALAKTIEELQRKLDNTKKTAFNPASLDPFRADLNLLGLAFKAVGGSAEEASERVLNAFRAGRLGVGEAAKQLKQIRDITEGGIPGAVGAVEDAFRNVLRGGEQGGAFSLDAVRDVGVELRERFLKQAVPDRVAEFQRLTRAFDQARKARDQAVNDDRPAEEVERLGKEFAKTRKELEDFSSTVPQAGLSDLRQALLAAFDPTVVNGFFAGLDSAGISTLDSLITASDEAAVNVLAVFDQAVPSALAETAQEIQNLNNQLIALRNQKVGVEIELSSTALDAVAQVILDQLGVDTAAPTTNETTETTPPPTSTNGAPGLGSTGGGEPTTPTPSTPTRAPRAPRAPAPKLVRVSPGVYRAPNGNLVRRATR